MIYVARDLVDKDRAADDAAETTGLFVIVVVGLVITFILVPMRCYIRLRITKCFGIDDWFLVLAQLFWIASSALTLQGIRFGIGKHLDDIPLFEQDDLLKSIFINEIIYAVTVVLVRLTVGFLLLKIVSQHSKERIFVLVVMTISIVNAVHFLVWGFLQCQPLHHFWLRSSPGKCYERRLTIVLYVSSLTSILTEWSLALLPVYMAIRMLIMSLKDRIAISVVLGLGACASIATCVRMAYLGLLLQGKADVRYICGVIAIWATVENVLAISAACLATFRPLLAKLLDLTVRRASIGDISGRVLRRPSKNTHATGTLTERAASQCPSTQRNSDYVLDYSDRILADIEKQESDFNKRHSSTVTAHEDVVGRTMAVTIGAVERTVEPNDDRAACKKGIRLIH